MKAGELITAGRSWLGVPFRHQGRSRLGVDCVGYFEMLLQEGNALPLDYDAPRDYGRQPTGILQQIIERYCTRTDMPEPGALALIQWPMQKLPAHVGLLTGVNIIHCYESVGKVVEHRYGEPWVRRTVGIYRLPGVIYE